MSSSQQSLVDSFADLSSSGKVRPETNASMFEIMSIELNNKCIFGCESNNLKTITETMQTNIFLTRRIFCTASSKICANHFIDDSEELDFDQFSNLESTN